MSGRSSGATKPPWGRSMPMYWTWLESSVPNSGYRRVLVVAMRAPEIERAQLEGGIEALVVKLGLA